MEAIQEIFSAVVLVRGLLWQEDARVIWTQAWEHDHGWIWEKVPGTSQVYELHHRREGQNSNVPKWSTIHIQGKKSVSWTQEFRGSHKKC